MKQKNLDNYYLFNHKNISYLYQIDSGDAFRINQDLADQVRRIKRNPGECSINQKKEVIDFICEQNQNLSELYRQQDILSAETKYLKSISLNVAQDCNMRCKYCYGNGGTYSQNGYMNFDTAVRAINWFARSSPQRKLSVIFFGGEPLLNFILIKYLVHYIENAGHLKHKQFEYSITTNGTIFNQEIIAFLNKHRFNVTISFDGDKQVQNYNRPMRDGRASYRLVMRNMKRFLKSREGNAFARVTITSGPWEWKNISQKLRKTGFRRYDYAPVTAHKSTLFALSDAEYGRLYDDLERQADDLIDNYEADGPGAALRIWDTLLSLKSYNKKYHGCGAGRSLLAISSSGKIYPCHRFVGNDRMCFGEISALDYGMQDKFLDVRSGLSDECKSCWARSNCGGGCLQNNYVHSGHIKKPDPRYCKEIKRRIEMAIYVYDILKRKGQVS
jgi:uncharacterized protein